MTYNNLSSSSAFLGTCKDDLKSSSSAISSSIQSVSTPCMRRVRLGSRLPYTSLSSSTCTAWGVAQNTTSRVRNRFDPLPTTSCRPRPYRAARFTVLMFRLGTDFASITGQWIASIGSDTFYHCLINKQEMFLLVGIFPSFLICLKSASDFKINFLYL
jgi:hypothetical protein